jgi:hypothetical protein
MIRVKDRGRGNAKCDASHRHTKSLPDNQPQNIRVLGAQRAPYADFMRPLRYRIGDRTVEPHHGQQQCDTANRFSNSIVNRCRPRDASIRSSMVPTAEIACSRSIADTWLRTVFTKRSGSPSVRTTRYPVGAGLRRAGR